MRRIFRRFPSTSLICAALLAFAIADPASAARRFPDILIITVDTLRSDRLSGYGYERPTSPAIDRLMSRGVRFTEARVVEPLTTPSLCSMLTSLYPHEHGSSRNGIPMRPGLPSLAKVLERRGYRTAAFVGNWTLRDRLSGLGPHFGDFHQVSTRKRWFGLFNAEATADDLNAEAVDWLEQHLDEPQRYPFFLWVHYVEPHAPYRFHEEHAEALGIDARRGDETSASDRYDTEVAFVDRALGELLERVSSRVAAEDLLVVFTSDHGESLGEHDYWGHGRHLYDVTLRVPLAIVWKGRVPPATSAELTSVLDLAPTVLGLVGLPAPETFRGHDWAAAITAGAAAGEGPNATFHQAHKGAIRGGGGEQARRNGLLEVAVVGDGVKEILRVRKKRGLQRFELASDPLEQDNRAPSDAPPSALLAAWLAEVQAGLDAADELPVPSLDEESVERLRALGYID